MPLRRAAEMLAEAVEAMRFSPPVTHVYNPLTYAWEMHALYLSRYGQGRKKIVFLGMNPGPFGMAQNGVPFGDIPSVRDWLQLDAPIHPPAVPNPHRPVEGMACTRVEVSGQRFWGLMRQRFTTPDAFFADHFVANYCPLAFFDKGRNVTPDKLAASEAAPLLSACDAHVRAVIGILQPSTVVGIGKFARAQAERALKGLPVRVVDILHPSPASPLANRGWAEQATRQLETLALWPQEN